MIMVIKQLSRSTAALQRASALTYDNVISLANELTGHLRVSVQKHDGTMGLYCHADILLPAWIVGYD